MSEGEEELESVHSIQKKNRQRKAFMKLARRVVAVLIAAMILSNEAFMARPREPGVNRAKLVPLQLAISGAVHWGCISPMSVRNPRIEQYVNASARALLVPAEYIKAK